MARYEFTTNGHRISIRVDVDVCEISHDGRAVTDIAETSQVESGGFQVVEEGEVCNYEWQLEHKSSFLSPTVIHTLRRNGEVVLEIEVEAP